MINPISKVHHSPLPRKDSPWSDKTTTLQSDDDDEDGDDGNDSAVVGDSDGGGDSIDDDGHQHLDCVKSHALVIGFSVR